MPAERLQKIIAAAGITSRRKAEQLISGGLVSVNGTVVTELGTKADLAYDHIRVNGKLLKSEQPHVYYMMNKPKGHVTTASDPQGRPTVMDLLRNVRSRVYPIGRLDYASEGLLLFTNDGDLANLLTRAASHVPKTYVIKVSGLPSEKSIEDLRSGVFIFEGEGKTEKRVRTAPAQIHLVKESANPWYEVTLIEGRNRQIRKMFEAVGHHVEKIRRVRYGPLRLDVEPGQLRPLSVEEVADLLKAASHKQHLPKNILSSPRAVKLNRKNR